MTENRSLDDFFDTDDTEDDAGPVANRDDTAVNTDTGDVEPDTDVEDVEPDADAEDTDSGETDIEDADSDSSAVDTESRESAVDDAGTAETETDDASSATPSRATFRWTPGGDDCPSCGRSVERQWRDGDRFVCTDCKAW